MGDQELLGWGRAPLHGTAGGAHVDGADGEPWAQRRGGRRSFGCRRGWVSAAGADAGRCRGERQHERRRPRCGTGGRGRCPVTVVIVARVCFDARPTDVPWPAYQGIVAGTRVDGAGDGRGATCAPEDAEADGAGLARGDDDGVRAGRRGGAGRGGAVEGGADGSGTATVDGSGSGSVDGAERHRAERHRGEAVPQPHQTEAAGSGVASPARSGSPVRCRWPRSRPSRPAVPSMCGFLPRGTEG